MGRCNREDPDGERYLGIVIGFNDIVPDLEAICCSAYSTHHEKDTGK